MKRSLLIFCIFVVTLMPALGTKAAASILHSCGHVVSEALVKNYSAVAKFFRETPRAETSGQGLLLSADRAGELDVDSNDANDPEDDEASDLADIEDSPILLAPSSFVHFEVSISPSLAHDRAPSMLESDRLKRPPRV